MGYRIGAGPDAGFDLPVATHPERAGTHPSAAVWTGRYLHHAMAADAGAALLAGLIALSSRFHGHLHVPVAYQACTACLPVIWLACVALGGGYEPRLVGTGADEYRRVINCGLGLASAVAIVSYFSGFPGTGLSRGYLFAALPSIVGLDLAARYWLRQRLHRVRTLGGCMHRTVAVGHPQDVADLAGELRRAPHHGLSVVAACLTESDGSAVPGQIAGVPVYGGLDAVVAAVRGCDADTVTVLACPQMNGMRLRRLAWDLEKTHTALCVAPALLDIAGPRTSIRPVAGLPLLHVDHPELTGALHTVKTLLDKLAAVTALVLLSPLLAAIAATLRLHDGGPVLAGQVRVGRNGRMFRLYTFRTVAADAGRTLAWLRSETLTGLPQLINVIRGQISLVGPRALMPEEAIGHGDRVGRRLAVRPGITGLWRIHGIAGLPPQEADRLDLHYIENWSFALDLQIFWKSRPAVFRNRRPASGKGPV